MKLKRLLRLSLFAGIGCVVQLIWAKSALAWGPAVHTVTALSLLSDTSLIAAGIANILTSFPREYLYGCLAADFFIGKGNRKTSKHPHNWQGGFRFLWEAASDREKAFAYGFLSHLAADVVAHNLCMPQLISSSASGLPVSHLYWEMKADHLVGPAYLKFARQVLTADHPDCDDLLNLISSEKKNGVKAKKRLYAQTLKFSDYYYTTRDLFFAGKAAPVQDICEFLSYMVNLSSKLVKEFLKDPWSSKCLSYDPMGRDMLRLARRKRMLIWLFGARKPISHSLSGRRTR
jgi:hypothetical protein